MFALLNRFCRSSFTEFDDADILELVGEHSLILFREFLVNEVLLECFLCLYYK